MRLVEKAYVAGVVVALSLLFWTLTAGVPADGTHVNIEYTPATLSEQRDSLVAREARRADVPVSLALAVSHVENWTGDSMAVSSRGAVGLMQVLPRYWQHEFEEECGCGSLFIRQRNACVGVRVLRHYLDKQPTVDKALRAYHGSLQLHTAGDQYVSLVLERMAT